MNFKFISIHLKCKSGNIDYKFNDHITALYGNIGVGKTSLMNLIGFCLGNDLVRTLAIDEQVLSCTLKTLYFQNEVSFTRKLSSNFITITTNGKEQCLRIKDGFPEKTITDFFYEKEGVQALFWMSKKSSSAHRKTKITFPNFYWFSYLNQDEIDSSLFYFKDSQNYYKEIASRSVLFNCLGGNSQVEAEYQNRLRNYAVALDETNKRITFINEIRETTQLFSINLSNEIIKKKREVLSLQVILDQLTAQINRDHLSCNIAEMLEIQHKIGLYEAEIKYLTVFGKMKTLLDSQTTLKKQIENELTDAEIEKAESRSTNQFFNKNLDILKELFQETLISVGFPGMDAGDYIKLYSRDFSPILYSYGGRKKADFYTLSSGGKKTIYKVCFAIAIHRLIKKCKLKTLIPQVLIIDTPMKNISEREDANLYNGLFTLLFNLFKSGGELDNIQLIIVDKELHPLFDKDDITQYHFTNDKPLIPFYHI